MSDQEFDRVNKGQRETFTRGRLVGLSSGFTAWLDRLEVQGSSVEFDFDGALKVVYISSVALAASESLERLWRDAGNQPLRTILNLLDQTAEEDDKTNADGLILPEACELVARDWLTTHPDSAPAKVVESQGLESSVMNHVRLIAEMYREEELLRGAQTTDPLFVMLLERSQDSSPKT